MEEKTYSAAIIGTGRIGFSLGLDEKREQPASHTMAILENKRIFLESAADTNAENLEKWKNYVLSKNPSVKIYKTSLELFSAHVPDIVVVSVNEDAHLEECLCAINARPRLVILEKPVALNSLEAQKIEQAAKEKNVPVMVNHERRFSADYRAAKDFLSKIGEIQSVRASLCSGLRVWAKEFENDGAYSLLHDGTHLVDIVHFLLGVDLSKETPVVTGIVRDEKGIVRNFSAHYQTEKISEIQFSMSGRSRFFSFDVEILGTIGKICIGNGYAKFYERKESKLYTGFYSLESVELPLPKKTGYFSGMIQNAVDFLDGTSALGSTLQDATKDLLVLEAIKAHF